AATPLLERDLASPRIASLDLHTICCDRILSLFHYDSTHCGDERDCTFGSNDTLQMLLYAHPPSLMSIAKAYYVKSYTDLIIIVHIYYSWRETISTPPVEMVFIDYCR